MGRAELPAGARSATDRRCARARRRPAAVVEHPGGPLLVLAGPGTGKTTTLVEAAVARVDAGVPVEQHPDADLQPPRGRRAARPGDRAAGPHGPRAGRPHAALLRLRRAAHGQRRARACRAPRLLAGARAGRRRSASCSRDAAGAGWPAALRPALRTRAFAGELRDLLMRAVERGLDGPALAALGRRAARADWVAAGRVPHRVPERHRRSRDPGAYDPAELIRSALNALRRRPGAAAPPSARRRRRIFVDEYQDTDPAQAELLPLLAARRRRARPRRRSRPVDLRLPRRRRVGDPRRRRAVRHGDGAGRRAAGVAPRGPAAAGRDRGASPTGCPGRAEQRRLAAARRDRRTASRSACSAPPARRPPTSPACCARAHLDGMPWSRMAVLVRSTATVLGRAAPRARSRAGVPVAVRGEDLPLAEQPAVAHAARACSRCVHDPAALDRGRRRAAAARPDRRRRHRLAAAAAPRAARAGRPPTRPVLLGAGAARRRVRSRCCPSTCAGRSRASPACWQPDATCAADAHAPRTCCGRCGRPRGLARRWQAGERRRRRGRRGGRPRPRRRRRSCSTPPPASPTGCRGRRCAGSPNTSPPSRSRATRSPPAARARGASTILTAHASKGLEWDLVCVAARAGGQLARPAPPRLAARLRSSSSTCVAGRDTGLRGRRSAARRGAPAVLRRRHPRPRSGSSSPRCSATRSSRRASSTSSTRSTANASSPPAASRHAPARRWSPSCARSACDPTRADPLDREAAAAELARLAAGRRARRRPRTVVGARADVSDDGPAGRPRSAGAGQPVAHRLVPALRAALAAAGSRRARRRRDLGLARARSCTRSPRARRPMRPPTSSSALLDEQWDGLDFGARWYRAQRARSGPRAHPRACSSPGCDASRAELDLRRRRAGRSGPSVGDAVLAGRVDRLERDDEGRLVVIDLKTGKSQGQGRATSPQHPQLGAYQLAVEAGALRRGRAQPAARVLVQLAAAGQGPEQRQAPAGRGRRPDWIAATQSTTSPPACAVTSSPRAATATAAHCDLQTCCPLQSGRPAGDDVSTPRHRRRVPVASRRRATERAARPARADRGAGGRHRGTARARPSSSPAPGRARPRRWPRASCGWSPTGWSRPDAVLGLTFTRKAAAELGQRIRRRLAQWRQVVERDRPDDAEHLAELLAGEPTVLDLRRLRRPAGRPSTRCGWAPNPTPGCISPAVGWQLADEVVAAASPDALPRRHRRAVVGAAATSSR